MIFTNLKKTYEDRTVLNVPSLELERGKIYAVVGHNGSGKSTLAKLLARVEEADEPVAVGGCPLSKSEIKVCYAAQNPYAFNFSMEKNILVNACDDEPAGESKAKAEQLIKAFGMEKLRRKNAKKLSGGETAKMALARAMIRNYDILILDEPTAAMDEESKSLAEALIKDYVKRTGATVVLITHEYDQTQRIADKTIHLQNGEMA